MFAPPVVSVSVSLIGYTQEIGIVSVCNVFEFLLRFEIIKAVYNDYF